MRWGVDLPSLVGLGLQHNVVGRELAIGPRASAGAHVARVEPHASNPKRDWYWLVGGERGDEDADEMRERVHVGSMRRWGRGPGPLGRDAERDAEESAGWCAWRVCGQ